jgi:hypothetical protein
MMLFLKMLKAITGFIKYNLYYMHIVDIKTDVLTLKKTQYKDKEQYKEKKQKIMQFKEKT